MLKSVIKNQNFNIYLNSISKRQLSKNENHPKPFSQIPGPKSYPFIGNLLELKTFG
jgi:hypothetical protein